MRLQIKAGFGAIVLATASRYVIQNAPTLNFDQRVYALAFIVISSIGLCLCRCQKRTIPLEDDDEPFFNIPNLPPLPILPQPDRAAETLTQPTAPSESLTLAAAATEALPLKRLRSQPLRTITEAYEAYCRAQQPGYTIDNGGRFQPGRQPLQF